MCILATPKKSTKTTRKLVGRFCRFMVDLDVASRLLADANWVPFGIFLKYDDGSEEASFYWLACVEGGWRVHKENPAGGGEVVETYHIDDSFGPVAEQHWSCSCPAGTYRGRKSANKPCRHVLAVAALLRRLGYDVPTAKAEAV